MARRRMFTAELIDSDNFTDMSVQAQMLYICLSVHADDEGFLSSAKRLSAPYGGEQSLRELDGAGFIIRFESGVLAITDWHLQNTIRKDRSVGTTHQTERQKVTIIDGKYMLCEENAAGDNQVTTICQPNDNQVTTICQPNDNQVTTNCQPFANHLATQNRIEENIIENTIIDNSSPDQSSSEQADGKKAVPAEILERTGRDDEPGIFKDDYIIPDHVPPSLPDVFRYFTQEKMYNANFVEFYFYYEDRDWLDGNGQPIKNWKAMARRWNDGNQPKK